MIAACLLYPPGFQETAGLISPNPPVLCSFFRTVLDTLLSTCVPHARHMCLGVGRPRPASGASHDRPGSASVASVLKTRGQGHRCGKGVSVWVVEWERCGEGCGMGVGETAGSSWASPSSFLEGHLVGAAVSRAQEGKPAAWRFLGGGPPLPALELGRGRQPRVAAWASVSRLSSRLLYEPGTAGFIRHF